MNIHWETVRENDLDVQVGKIDGISLCSQRAPLAESEKWVQGLAGFLSLSSFERPLRIAVLGLGAGHHIKLLSEKYPHVRVKVFEMSQDLILYFQEHLRDVSRNVEVSSFDEHALKDMKLQIFDLIVEFPAATQWARASYSSLCESLKGNDSKILQYTRDQELHELSNALVQMEKRNLSLNIKSLQLFINRDNVVGSLSEEAKLWLTLAELVR